MYGVKKAWRVFSVFLALCYTMPEPHASCIFWMLQMDFVFEPNVKIKMRPLQYLFKLGSGSYCLGIFDNQQSGTLLGGISVRNVLVQVNQGPLHAICPLLLWST